MSYFFRNYNLKEIKEILKLIGEHRYNVALRQMNISEPPKNMKAFFLQAEKHNVYLCFNDNSRYTKKIMRVENLKNLPKKSWVLIQG